jgi:hypothetical protein
MFTFSKTNTFTSTIFCSDAEGQKHAVPALRNTENAPALGFAGAVAHLLVAQGAEGAVCRWKEISLFAMPM